LFPLFGKFTAGIVDIGRESMTQSVLVAKVTAVVVDSGVNLPLVSLIPVVHLNLRISPQIFENIEMSLMLFSGAWWKMIHEKNIKEKSHDTAPLRGQQ
jgi:hypothetical protein